jgi:hypothetical protein
MAYHPQPIETSSVTLSAELRELTERLAENAHDHWAVKRFADGWTLGPRDNVKKQNPCLIPYADLPEAEKDFDRTTAMETLKAIVKLGYRIEKFGTESTGMS